MSEINLADIEFDESLIRNVRLFDEVLKELGELPLFENRKFTVYSSPGIFPHYLVMETTNEKENTVPITVWFEGDSLRIDLEEISETFDWSKENIDNEREKVVEFIRNLFTGYILIETRGASRFIQIFDADGSFVQPLSYNNLFHMLTGLYLWRHKNYRRLYLPMFSKKI